MPNRYNQRSSRRQQGRTALAAKTTSTKRLVSPFLELPAELRVRIYEWLFTNTESEHINLAFATPPSKPITLVSRSTRKEAWPIYQRSYQNYWTTNAFVIPYHDIQDTKKNPLKHSKGLVHHGEDLGNKILALDQNALYHITKLSLVYETGFCINGDLCLCRAYWRLIDDRGGWLYDGKQKGYYDKEPAPPPWQNYLRTTLYRKYSPGNRKDGDDVEATGEDMRLRMWTTNHQETDEALNDRPRRGMRDWILLLLKEANAARCERT